jgi:hypothetical protein
MDFSAGGYQPEFLLPRLQKAQCSAVLFDMAVIRANGVSAEPGFRYFAQ